MDEKFKITTIGRFIIEYQYDITLDDLKIPVWYFKNHYTKKPIIFKEDHIIITNPKITSKNVEDEIKTKKRTMQGYKKKYNNQNNYNNFFNPKRFNDYCNEILLKYSKKLKVKPPVMTYWNSKNYYGYCTGRKIKINKALIFDSKREIIDTICHELVHTLRGYKDYDKKFYDKLEWLMDEKTD